MTTPSPLLANFKNYYPSNIFDIASKAHLIKAFEACKTTILASAAWNADKTALTVTFIGGFQTTLQAAESRLLTKCNCREWQPARNCPHVAIVWATLKRLMSPDTLAHISFNPQLLRDMQSYLDETPLAQNRATSPAHDERKKGMPGLIRLLQNSVRSNAPKYRLLIEQNAYGNGLRGAIKRGDESIYGWSSGGIPKDLARFLASHHHFDGSQRYFEMFRQMTDDNYPIVFRDNKSVETTMVYHRDQPCRSGITFDLRGDEIHISRSMADGTLLSADTMVYGQVFIDPSNGCIQPVSDHDAWKTWDIVLEELDGLEDEFGEDDWEEEENYWNADKDETDTLSPEIQLLHHTIIVPRQLFNVSGLRFTSVIIDEPDSSCHFLIDGVALAAPEISTPSYLLDIPAGLNSQNTHLEPVSCHDTKMFPFSQTAFWLFNPLLRSNLSTPMKTKKRVRAVIEASFALLDESKLTARNSIIRSVTSSGDFLKRDVKREAKQLITALSETWDQTLLIVTALPGGWSFLKDAHRTQARMIRILYETFGLEAFSGDSSTIGLELPTERLLKHLPLLSSQLHEHGFSLRIGNEPLTKASWEFSLDATRSNQDWFELKPEIRCNGEILTEEELRGLMDGSGMLHRNGTLMLLDEISTQVLAMFAGSMPVAKKKKKGEQELVRVPRLQILDWLQLRSHGVTVRLSPDDARILESLLNFSSIPERRLPDGLNATLRHYQVDAWHWLAFLYDHRFGACLADDMGLGKTLQGITLLAGIMSGEIASAAPPGTPHMVVAPPSLLFNWEAEIARFLPAARVLLYSGSGRSSDGFANYDIIITSYGVVQRDCELLAEHRFNVLIFDETQVVKNLQAATTNAVRKLKGTFTLALTGTPVENHLGEYFAIMDLCLPGLLGTREEFSRTVGRDGAAGTARLIGRTKPFVLRRTKQLIANELPPKIEIDIPLELTTKQKALYQRTVEEVRGLVKDAYDSHAPAQARIIALTAILRLRQICLAPALAAPGTGDTSPKLEFLGEQLAELRDEGHSVLVFSQFTGYLDIIEKGLRERGFSCLRLDGSTPVPQRKKLVQSFQNSSEPTVFLISLKAGGKGLNLTRATYVYHMDPWWNPAVENQASDRAHRIGQTEQVTITRLIMRHTIEEKMMALKEQKTKLYKTILEDGAGSGGTGLTREEFEFLLG